MSTTLLKTIATSIVLAAVAVSAVSAADPIETRRAVMKGNGAAFGGVLVKTAKGETPYDAAAVRAALDALVTKTAGFTDLFPKGTETGGDTAAAPKIWEDPAGFKAALAKLQETAKAQTPAATTDLAGLKVAVGEIGKTCKGCHDSYRISKN
ncbi:cytochrome c [Siculibacillus lacustris]|uniref:Cytochrome c n=1 Tax=Siculibacillus lacustris TaxID=1549641 RepID=A0A4Q9VIP0_9HYPH|nr:cytochrome c [Siculibacillus lacustris]TBW34614.1 cytochrome c [Siculibacillus lacustris]